jgi:hypothetical protein
MRQRIPYLVVAISIVSILRAMGAVQASEPRHQLAINALDSVPIRAAVPTSASSYVGIAPCRVVDTRGNGFGGAYGPPSLAAGSPRTFVITGECGIPSNAQAVVVNLTVILPTAEGFLTAFPSGGSVPTVSNVNFSQGQVVANSAIAPLGDDGGLTVFTGGANADLVIDVNGYFAAAPPTAQKLCIVISLAGANYRDTVPVTASWTESTCAAYRNQIFATSGGGDYQLGCLFDTGISLGAPNGGPPAMNCGW